MTAIDVLVKAWANIEARDDAGCTPLHSAADELPSLEALLALLKYGARVNTKSADLQTPLHLAAAGARNDVAAADFVDCLSRSGADETILDNEGKLAADIVGEGVNAGFRQADDIERVRQLLANAPADRAWRRWGYLVLCRAHPDRMRPMHENRSTCASVTRSCAELASTETGSCTGTAADCSFADGQTGDGWSELVARLLVLREKAYSEPLGGVSLKLRGERTWMSIKAITPGRRSLACQGTRGSSTQTIPGGFFACMPIISLS